MIRNAYAYAGNRILMHFIVTWPPERSHEVHTREVSPWGFNSASGRVTFTGNILKTSHVADRKKDFRMILVVYSVPTLCIIKLEIG
jgi:hypothetical protein